MHIIEETQIRDWVSLPDAIPAVRDAFVALAAGRAIMPPPVEIDFPHAHADFHVKGAFMQDFPYFTFKLICGFYDNAAVGLPVTSGITVLFDSATGVIEAVLKDNGYLTQLRTAAAGALSMELLANKHVQQAAIIGSGTQAAFQLEAILATRRPERILVYSRSVGKARAFAAAASERYEVNVSASTSIRDACRGSQLIVTTTPSRSPLLFADWIEPGTHITAVGSDVPAKQELDTELLRLADVVVADLLSQCRQSGEIHHALDAGTVDPNGIIELGAVASGATVGRRSTSDITVADLTGLGIQDAAVGSLVGRQIALSRSH